jgi:hypothetical protein
LISWVIAAVVARCEGDVLVDRIDRTSTVDTDNIDSGSTSNWSKAGEPGPS